MLAWTRFALLVSLALTAPACVVVVDDGGGGGYGGGDVAVDDGYTDADYDATFTLVNGSPVDIYAVFVSPSDEDDWGPDILGVDVLYQGDSTQIALDPGLWDIRVVDGDVNEYFDMGVEFPPGADIVHTFDLY